MHAVASNAVSNKDSVNNSNISCVQRIRYFSGGGRWEVGVNKINALIRVYGIVRARYVFGGRNNRVITPTLVRVTLEIMCF